MLHLPVTTTTCVPAHRSTRSWPYLLILYFHSDSPLRSTRQPFSMSTYVPVRQCTCSVYFFFFGITCTMTFQLIYWGTYTQVHPKIDLPVYLHASLSSNHKDPHVSTTTCVPAHTCTRSRPYLLIFTFILITVKIYPSTFLLFYMSTYVPVHHYTCSVYFFFFGITCAMIFQLIYLGTYTQILPIDSKINLPVYPHASLSTLQQRPTCLHNYLCIYP